MKISCIMLSHNRANLLKKAVTSVLAQTMPDWEIVLIDSGVLIDQPGALDFITDPRIKIRRSLETAAMRGKFNLAGVCFNDAFERGWVTGDLVLYLCDDDIFYPNAFQAFADFWETHDKKPDAMYASEDMRLVDREGKESVIGQRLAKKPAGRLHRGVRMDCRVDYLQFCHTLRILSQLPKRPHPESLKDVKHADGLFMEMIGDLTMVYPIPDIIGANYRYPSSINPGYAETKLGRMWVILREKFSSLWS